MRAFASALLLPLTLAACGGGGGASGATVDHAVVTMPAVPGRPGAAYFTVHTTRATRLTGLSSPAAARIELHETMSHGNMSAMAPLRDPRVIPDAPLTFAPGGRHAMLYDLAPSVRIGQRIRLDFTFESLPPVSVEAEVRGPGDAGH